MEGNKEAKEEKLSLNDFYVIFAGMRGVRRGTIEALYNAGYTSLQSIASSSVEELTSVKGVGERVAEKLISRAREYLREAEGGVREILESVPRLRGDVMEEIMKRYPGVEELKNATVEELMEIKGVGRAIALKIIEAAGGAVEGGAGGEMEGVGREEERGKNLEEFLEAFKGMRGIRKVTFESIYNAGYNTVEKVASATLDELIEVKNVGPKAAVRIIERAREITGKMGEGVSEEEEEISGGEGEVEKLLNSIPRLRKDVREEILRRYPELKSLRNATKEELMEIKGVGEWVAEKIIEAVSGAVVPEVKEGEGGEEVKTEEKPKEKKSGALEGILKGFKGIAEKIKGIFFPEKKKIKEETEGGARADEGGEAGKVEKKIERFEDIEGVSEEIAKKLREGGYKNVEELKEATVEDLIMIDGIDEELARKILNSI